MRHLSPRNESRETILLTKTTVALSYHRVRGLYFMAVVFVRSIVRTSNLNAARSFADC